MLIGEVHTGLTQNSTRVTGADAVDLLALWRGRRVRLASRPMLRAFSPDVPVGVHCRLPTRSGARPYGIGTLATRVCLTGGRLLQATTRATLVPAERSHRLPWSHYLARLGTVELLGGADPDDLARGYLRHPVSVSIDDSAALLDTGSVTARLLDSVQRAAELDRLPPFRAPRTRFRFAITWSDGSAAQARPASSELVVDDDLVRTLRVHFAAPAPGTEAATLAADAYVELCEDVARHDWLLTTTMRFLDVSRVDSDDDADVVSRLRPAIKHLLPLWMPGAGVNDDLLPVWKAMERRPGFSRQWENIVAHIRDQLALAAVSSAAKGEPM